MSTVILSGLPFDCQESDIHRALLMYGTAIDIQLHRQHQQAFVTMRTQMEAQALLSRKTVNVLGSTVRVDQGPQVAAGGAVPQHSLPMGLSGGSNQGYGANLGTVPGASMSYPQQLLPPPPLHQVAPPSLPYQMPPQAQQQPSMYQPLQQSPLPPPPPSSYSAYNGSTSGGGAGGYAAPSVFPTQPPSPMYSASAGDRTRSPRLRVVVEDCKFPITREVLLEMFNMVDRPLHVYCGPPGPTTTGDVEFASVESSERAMLQFNNKNVYPGCCMLRLSYAPLRDNFSSGAYGSGIGDGQSVMPLPSSYTASSTTRDNNYGDATSTYQPYQAEQQRQQSQQVRQQSQPYAPSATDDAMLMMSMGRGGRGASSYAGRGMARGGRGSTRGGVNASQSGFDPMRAPQHASMMMASPYDSRRAPFPGQQVEEATVVVSNVATSVPLYDLWVLLEVFGNVNSLKRQYKENTNVAAQFQHAQDAKTAVFFLQGCPFRGNVLGLKLFAGYVERGGRVEWNAGPATDPATQAFLFTSGYHHRTKPSAPFNPLGRIRPDKNIFVSNLIEAITDDEVKSEFTKAGVEVESYFRKDATAAIVGFKDTETAIDGLIAVHAKQLKDRYLRITFSRFPPGPRDENAKDGDRGRLGAGENEEAVGKAINDIIAEVQSGRDEDDDGAVAPSHSEDVSLTALVDPSDGTVVEVADGMAKKEPARRRGKAT